jgi:nicotinate-nucleotide adenylyltransferase
VSSGRRRIGVLGGTFDPPHVGHLLAASDAFEALALDELLLVPAAEQPLKRETVVAPASDRLAMTRLLVEGDRRFRVDALEIDRGGLSFTVDTLRTLQARFGGASAVALVLLIGQDVVSTLPKWREPEALASLVDLVVLTRSSGEIADARVGRTIATRQVDVSSTEIRARVRAGQSIHGFVPDAVAAYIAARGLYR